MNVIDNYAFIANVAKSYSGVFQCYDWLTKEKKFVFFITIIYNCNVIRILHIIWIFGNLISIMEKEKKNKKRKRKNHEKGP